MMFITKVITMLCGVVSVVLSSQAADPMQPASKDLAVDEFQPCAFLPTPSPFQPAMPKLHQQFAATIEAKILQKNKTLEVTEYYDYVNNQGAVYSKENGRTRAVIYNFEKYEVFFVTDDVCVTANLRDRSTFHVFNFTFGKEGGHLTGAADLFQFGSQYGEQYIGNDVARGIPVSRWSACMHWVASNMTFQMDYYFSRPNYSLPFGKGEIPIRATLKGKALDQDNEHYHNYEHIYDFTSYTPGEIKDPSVFKTPSGVVCKHDFTQKKTPLMPDHFSLQSEFVLPDLKHSSTVKIYFDFPANLTRVDMAYVQNVKHKNLTYVTKYGHGPFDIIHDFSTGLQYVIDSVRRNCSITPIAANGMDVDVNKDTGQVSMRHGRELMHLDGANMYYQGQRPLRGIPCDVWAVVQVDSPEQGTNTTKEIYYTQVDWTYGTFKHAEHYQIPVGTIVKQTSFQNGKKITLQTMMQHGFNFADQEPDISKFSIRDCFPGEGQVIHAMFKLKGLEDDYIDKKPYKLIPAIRAAIVEYSGIEPIRVDDIYVEKARGEGLVKVWFSLLERSEVEGNVRDPVPSLTVDECFRKLQVANDGGDLSVLVSWEDKEQPPMKVYVVRSSLKTDIEAFEPESSSPQYSAGSMAGLGIAMLLIGIAGTLLAIFIMNKRGMEIPYLIQE